MDMFWSFSEAYENLSQGYLDVIDEAMSFWVNVGVTKRKKPNLASVAAFAQLQE